MPRKNPIPVEHRAVAVRMIELRKRLKLTGHAFAQIVEMDSSRLLRLEHFRVSWTTHEFSRADVRLSIHLKSALDQLVVFDRTSKLEHPDGVEAGLVCEHCGRAGSPSMTLRQIGSRLRDACQEVEDCGTEAADAGEGFLANQLYNQAEDLGRISSNLLGLELPSGPSAVSSNKIFSNLVDHKFKTL